MRKGTAGSNETEDGEAVPVLSFDKTVSEKLPTNSKMILCLLSVPDRAVLVQVPVVDFCLFLGVILHIEIYPPFCLSCS